MSAEPVRDSITGDAVTATHDGHFVTVSDGVPVLHLSQSAALKLAQQLIAAAEASA